MSQIIIILGSLSVIFLLQFSVAIYNPEALEGFYRRCCKLRCCLLLTQVLPRVPLVLILMVLLQFQSWFSPLPCSVTVVTSLGKESPPWPSSHSLTGLSSSPCTMLPGDTWRSGHPLGWGTDGFVLTVSEVLHLWFKYLTNNYFPNDSLSFGAHIRTHVLQNRQWLGGFGSVSHLHCCALRAPFSGQGQSWTSSF